MSFSNSKQTQTLTFEFSHLARFSPFSAPVPPRLETVRPLHGATEQFRRTLSLQRQHAVVPEAVPSDSRPSLCIFVFQVLFLLHFQELKYSFFSLFNFLSFIFWLPQPMPFVHFLLCVRDVDLFTRLFIFEVAFRI